MGRGPRSMEGGADREEEASSRTSPRGVFEHGHLLGSLAESDARVVSCSALPLREGTKARRCLGTPALAGHSWAPTWSPWENGPRGIRDAGTFSKSPHVFRHLFSPLSSREIIWGWSDLVLTPEILLPVCR